ncbi:MAG: hypothetical protein ACYC9S_05800 [Leptospirales bacterium]
MMKESPNLFKTGEDLPGRAIRFLSLDQACAILTRTGKVMA